MMRLCLLHLTVAIAVASATAQLSAAEPAPQDRRIRRTAEEILSSPEFQGFERLTETVRSGSSGGRMGNLPSSSGRRMVRRLRSRDAGQRSAPGEVGESRNVPGGNARQGLGDGANNAGGIPSDGMGGENGNPIGDPENFPDQQPGQGNSRNGLGDPDGPGGDLRRNPEFDELPADIENPLGDDDRVPNDMRNGFVQDNGNAGDNRRMNNLNGDEDGAPFGNRNGNHFNRDDARGDFGGDRNPRRQPGVGGRADDNGNQSARNRFNNADRPDRGEPLPAVQPNRRARNEERAAPPTPPDRAPETRSTASSGGGFAGFLTQLIFLLAYVLIGLVCGFIIFLIVKTILEFRWPEKSVKSVAASAPTSATEPEHAPGEHPPDAYVATARQHANQGEYREAVAQLILGAMSRCERSGWVRFEKGLTVRNYLRILRTRKLEYTAFKGMVRVFEPLTFGRREANRQHFEQSLQAYETGFAEGKSASP